jgi:hypothetical protein
MSPESSISPLSPKAYESASLQNAVAVDKSGSSGGRTIKNIVHNIKSKINLLRNSKSDTKADLAKGTSGSVAYHLVRKGRTGENQEAHYDIKREQKRGVSKFHDIIKSPQGTKGFEEDIRSIAETIKQGIKEGSIPLYDGLLYLGQLETDVEGLAKNTKGEDAKLIDTLKTSLRKDIDIHLSLFNTQMNERAKVGQYSVQQGEKVAVYKFNSNSKSGVKLLDTPQDTSNKTFELGAGKNGYTLLLKIPISRLPNFNTAETEPKLSTTQENRKSAPQTSKPEGVYKVNYAPTETKTPGVNVRVEAGKVVEQPSKHTNRFKYTQEHEEINIKGDEFSVSWTKEAPKPYIPPSDIPQAGPEIKNDRKDALGDKERKSFETEFNGDPAELRPDSITQQESNQKLAEEDKK